VAALQAAGKPVFVNLTAAWCITCKLNERLVLRTEAVQAAFARHGVATLTGDWTQGDPAIGALLRENGREGVPLYLLYPAGGGSPQLLPQVLTEGVIRRAIGEAGGAGRTAHRPSAARGLASCRGSDRAPRPPPRRQDKRRVPPDEGGAGKAATSNPIL
jgi:thiol:disulfide interchange protein DsbD